MISDGGFQPLVCASLHGYLPGIAQQTGQRDIRCRSLEIPILCGYLRKKKAFRRENTERYYCREMNGYVISKEECDTLARYARETMGGLFAANPCEMSHEDCAGIFERAYRQEIRILETRTGRW